MSASQFTAIVSFSENVTGFFHFILTAYQKTIFNEQMEVLALTDDILVYKYQYKIYAHEVFGKKDTTAQDGHFMKGISHPTLEIILNESPE